jgi:hypothetical protein
VEDIMVDARRHPRMALRLPVDLYRGEKPDRGQCQTRDIGMGGLFAEGCKANAVGERLRIAIGGPSGSPLHLDARVVRIVPDGVGVEFVDNSPATLEVLRALLEPAWEGFDVIRDVAGTGEWRGSGDASGWMRLTSVVSDMRRWDTQRDP